MFSKPSAKQDVCSVDRRVCKRFAWQVLCGDMVMLRDCSPPKQLSDTLSRFIMVCLVTLV
jgi:hypothetical protein